MGFSQPIGPVELAAGAEVGLTAATQIDQAVIQGTLPSGVAYEAATLRTSTVGFAIIGPSASALLAAGNPDLQYIVKLVVITSSMAGVQAHSVVEQTAAGVDVRYLVHGYVDASKAPFLVPFGLGLAVARGNRIAYVSPAGAGSYVTSMVYDALIF